MRVGKTQDLSLSWKWCYGAIVSSNSILRLFPIGGLIFTIHWTNKVNSFFISFKLFFLCPFVTMNVIFHLYPPIKSISILSTPLKMYIDPDAFFLCFFRVHKYFFMFRGNESFLCCMTSNLLLDFCHPK